jgi:hypothetical protein
MRRVGHGSLLRGLGVLSLTVLALTGCGGSNGDGDASASGGRLTLRMTTVDQRSSQQAFSDTSGSLPRQVSPGDIDFVKCVQITITGPGITDPIEAKLRVAENQQGQFEGRFTKRVPLGGNRHIDVLACNESQDSIFRGEKTVDLGEQAEGCKKQVSPNTGVHCDVTINLARQAIWGIFRWGDPWGVDVGVGRNCECPET